MSGAPLVFALHSGKLYGTERMTLDLAAALAPRFRPILLAPPGPALREAERRGWEARPISSKTQLVHEALRLLRAHRELFLATTSITQALAFEGLNTVLRRRLRHVHAVHGGSTEAASYGRKRWLARFGVRFAAVSSFVKERLMAHGVRPARIEVIPNFLPRLRREAFHATTSRTGPVRKVLIVSRADPIKELDLLVDSVRECPALAPWTFTVVGAGSELVRLRERAAREAANVCFIGFQDDVADRMRNADLLLHTCSAEPFGLVILEAMAAGLPVLVPDRGGTAEIVDDGRTGFTYPAQDPAALVRALLQVSRLPDVERQRVTAAAAANLQHRFDGTKSAARYATLLERAAAV